MKSIKYVNMKQLVATIQLYGDIKNQLQTQQKYFWYPEKYEHSSLSIETIYDRGELPSISYQSYAF